MLKHKIKRAATLSEHEAQGLLLKLFCTLPLVTEYLKNLLKLYLKANFKNFKQMCGVIKSDSFHYTIHPTN